MSSPPPLAELKAICHGEKNLDAKPAWYTWHRRISIRITWFLLHTSVSANQVSWAMIAAGALAGALVTIENLATSVAACLLLYLSFLLDKVDGEIARYHGTESWSGVYLDWLYHRLVPGLFHIGLLFRVYLRHPSPWLLCLALLWGTILLLRRENDQVAYNLYPRKRAAAKREGRTDSAPPGGPVAGRRPAGKLLDPYYQPLGVGAVYLVVLWLDATLGVDLLSWVVCSGVALTVFLLTRGITRLSRGGIESDVARVASQNSGDTSS